MNRRSFIKYIVSSFLTVIGLSGGSYVYAREIEPSLVNTHQEQFKSKYLSDAFHNFKIVQFSDTHLGFQYTLNKLRKLAHRINVLKPDIIVFTGDLVDKPDTYEWSQELIDILKTLQAPYGKFWNFGNHDHGGNGTEVLKKVMEKADFQLLQNEHVRIKKNSEYFILAGVDDMSLGKPNIEKALDQTKEDEFKVLLSHAPDFADIARKYPVDIQLSGHSHGGQVRLPFVGHLYTPSYATKYIKGTYQFEHDRLQLYVNCGIGTTRLPLRFLCVPEIYELTLKKYSN